MTVQRRTASWMDEPGAFERAGLLGENATPIDDDPASTVGNPFASRRPSSRSRIAALVIRAIGALTILTLTSGVPFAPRIGTGVFVAAAALLGGVAAVRFGGARGRAVVSAVCLAGFGLFVAGAVLFAAVFALFALVYIANGGHQLF